MREFIYLGLNAAKSYGATYADIRVIKFKTQSISIKNGKAEEISDSESYGFGIRTLVSGAWGFASSFDISKKEVQKTASLSCDIARASASLKNEDVILASIEPISGSYKTPIKIDPFTVPLEDKLSILFEAEEILRKKKEVKISQSSMNFIFKDQIFASTEGAWIKQEIMMSGAGIEATAISEGDMQVRSYPNSHGGQFITGGYELVSGLQLKENAERVASEAVGLLKAKECPSKITTIILDGSQLALQVHESIGHPVELDRVLGMEASFAGTSFLTLDKLNQLKIGSEIVNITADATIPTGLGSFGYDDEGVPAQKTDIVKNGLFVGYINSRETAAKTGQLPNGAMRADGWNRIPLIRMTNVNLLPGKPSFDELIADTKDGIYLETNKSWSIDDKRLNFQFGTEIGWEIKNGKMEKMLKNPNYTGITPKFWNSCNGIANKDSWIVWGTPNCGKGEPMQVIQTGHGASPARFRNIQVGVGK
ncbi:TldD/PmbA family protein [Candidatus Oleimmundimicrobium sp.]|uniref:TldD/PmbA family protein n=1 Tax=Candidatus Oleimmundimicrobium sp. TaxID=3060597 RepID=UPI00272360C6|nr:TldD/PmbA family protein [Candidatus Oleimmundimicrobium sp.]MDO8886279.1 TldD/PmbA family protein [Candidatus Oleimmundimicrobium sp.]